MFCPRCTQIIHQLSCSFCQWSTHIQMEVFTAGQYLMGSPQNEVGRDPDEVEHWVVLDHDFALSRTEVSQELYQFVMGDNPSEFFASQNPVENITWYDAIEFCNRLSILERLQPVYILQEQDISYMTSHNGYRLPTEAEWELAAKETLNKHPELLHPPKNNWHTHTVGSDTHQWMSAMMGNVWEFCWDWYDKYPTQMAHNPLGPEKGQFKVIRGGSWVDNGRIFRAANRGFVDPKSASSTIGFRLAKNQPV